MDEEKSQSHVAPKRPAHRSNRLRKLIFVVLAALSVIGIASGFYAHAHRYIPGKITFQEYEPTYLPAGKQIKSKEIYADHMPPNSSPSSTYLSLDLSDEGVIYEGKPTDSDELAQKLSCSSKDAENVSCTQHTTPSGQIYALYIRTGIVPTDKSSSEQLYWVRNGTRIIINFEHPDGKTFTRLEIEKMIDSFKPVEYEGLPVWDINRSGV